LPPEDLSLWDNLTLSVKVVETQLGRAHRSEFDCTLAQVQVMKELFSTRSGLRVGELAARLAVMPSNISQIVKGLSAAGLVEQHPMEKDRRIQIVSLTARGRHVAASEVSRNRKEVEAYFACLTGDEKRVMSSLLRKIAAFRQAGIR